MESAVVSNVGISPWFVVVCDVIWQNVEGLLLRGGRLLQRLCSKTFLQLPEELVHLERGQSQELSGLKDAGGGWSQLTSFQGKPGEAQTGFSEQHEQRELHEPT